MVVHARTHTLNKDTHKFKKYFKGIIKNYVTDMLHALKVYYSQTKMKTITTFKPKQTQCEIIH